MLEALDPETQEADGLEDTIQIAEFDKHDKTTLNEMELGGSQFEKTLLKEFG